MQIIQRIDQALQISAISHLIGTEIMLEKRAIDVVVSRIAVDESVEK